MLPRHHPDRIRIAFDEHRLVANAGLLLPATLARRLGLPELVHNHLDLGGAPGRANTGDKMMTLVDSAPRFRGACRGALSAELWRGGSSRDLWAASPLPLAAQGPGPPDSDGPSSRWGGGGPAGRNALISVYSPGSDLTSTSPPCSRAMSWARLSPRPVLRPVSLVRSEFPGRSAHV